MYRFFIISIFLCATVTTGRAQDFHRADSLRMAGNYAWAATEYERCNYLATTTEEATQALRDKTQCYRQLQRYDLAVRTLERCIATYNDHLQLALCLYLSEQFPRVVETVENAKILFDTTTSDLLLLQTLALNEMGLYDSARTVALQMGQLLPPEQARTALSTIETLYAHTPTLKNETTARWLSIVPGLGHLYAGYPVEAASAFLINATALGFGIWQVFERCFITAYIGGAGLLSATYPGAMLSAEQHAQKTNARRIGQFNEQCREQLIGIH